MLSTPSKTMDAVRNTGADLLKLLRVRLELFSVELRQEEYRIAQVVILASLTAALWITGLALLTMLLIFFLWESARWMALCSMTVFYMAGALLVGWKLKCLLRDGRPFHNSTAELREDEACFSKKN